jgi:hypothetical protein
MIGAAGPFVKKVKGLEMKIDLHPKYRLDRSAPHHI